MGLVPVVISQPPPPNPAPSFFANVTLINHATNVTEETGGFYLDQGTDQLAYYAGSVATIYDCSKPKQPNIVIVQNTACTAACIQGKNCFSTPCTCEPINPWAALALATYQGPCPDDPSGAFWVAPQTSIPVNFPYAFCFSGDTPLYVVTLSSSGIVEKGVFTNFTPGAPNPGYFTIPSTCQCTNIYDDAMRNMHAMPTAKPT